MNARQLAIKVAASNEIDQEPLIAIFHKWIQENRWGDQLLIDVADYRHVHGGPGVMLIGHEAHYGFDRGRGRPGLRYAEKRDEVGPLADKLPAALRRTLEACAALVAEPALAGRLDFDPGDLEIEICDRLVAGDPEELAREVAAALEPLYGELEVTPGSDPRRAAAAQIKASAAPPLGELIARLGA